jgi:hypothetical protein
MKVLSLAAAAVVFAAPLSAQAAPAAAPLVDTGMIAPDFSAPGATQNGLLPSVKLSAYKGKTVVLAFFYKARTKG